MPKQSMLPVPLFSICS